VVWIWLLGVDRARSLNAVSSESLTISSVVSFVRPYFSRNPASFTSREFPPTKTLKAPGSASHLPEAV
jgi:hypothetical protein